MPSPVTQPPTTSSCSGRILTFCQRSVRLPGTYGERRSLAMIPSSPRTRAASKKAIPSASMCSLRRTRGSGAQDAGEESPPLLEWLVEERTAVEMEQVEDLVHEGGRLGGRSPSLDPRLEQRKVRLAPFVERDDLAVDDRLVAQRSRSADRGTARNTTPPRPSRRASRCAPFLPSTMVSTRKPSHLTSNSQSGSSNGPPTSVASIGAMNAGLGHRLSVRRGSVGSPGWTASPRAASGGPRSASAPGRDPCRSGWL